MNELLQVAPDATTHDGFDLSQLHADNQEQEQETAYNFNRADLMLRSVVRENRKPSFAELTFFKGRCAWSEIDVNNQTRRMRDTLRLQSVIGSSAQRKDINDENKTAREVLETEKPKLLKKLAAIHEQINELERSASSAHRRIEQVDNALSELAKPELLRADLLAKHKALVQHFAETTGQEMAALGVEIRHREILLDRPENCSLQTWLESVHRFDPSCVQYSVLGRDRVLRIVEPNWTLRKELLVDELETMRRTFAQLETIKAEHIGKVDALVSHYILENG